MVVVEDGVLAFEDGFIERVGVSEGDFVTVYVDDHEGHVVVDFSDDHFTTTLMEGNQVELPDRVKEYIGVDKLTWDWNGFELVGRIQH